MRPSIRRSSNISSAASSRLPPPSVATIKRNFPADQAARCAPAMIPPAKGLGAMSVIKPTKFVRALASERAKSFGRYPNSLAAALTRSWVSCGIRMSVRELSTNETVDRLMPRLRAMSSIDARRLSTCQSLHSTPNRPRHDSHFTFPVSWPRRRQTPPSDESRYPQRRGGYGAMAAVIRASKYGASVFMYDAVTCDAVSR